MFLERKRKSVAKTGRSMGIVISDLQMAAMQFCGWPTPASRDWKDGGDLELSRFRKDGKERNDTVPRQAALVGATPTGSPAQTASSGSYRLNPFFSLHLMGYPLSWGLAGILSWLDSKRR
jgi:hypothetical protein